MYLPVFIDAEDVDSLVFWPTAHSLGQIFASREKGRGSPSLLTWKHWTGGMIR